MDIEKIVNSILADYSEDEVRGMIDEVIPEYLDDDWEDEYEDQYEAYMETGRGEAESQIFHTIVSDYKREHNCKLDTDQFCEVLDGLREGWDITW